MNYYDTIRSSYDLGPGFKKDLHTKDLTRSCVEFWIDPAGHLYQVDYSHTQSAVCIDEHQFKLVKSSHGRVAPYYFWGEVEVYPAKWPVYYAPTPTCKIVFERGIISEVRR